MRTAAGERRTAIRWAVLLGGLVLAIGAAGAPVASAHAELLASEPASGGVVRDRAAPLEFHFSEAVDAAKSSVKLRSGGRTFAVRPLTHPAGDPRSLAGPVPASVPAAAVAVEWSSVSADDGHVARGRYGLKIAVAAPISAGPGFTVASPDPAGVAGLLTVARAASYLAMILLAGGVAFLILLWPAGVDVGAARRLLWVAWATGLVATGLGVALDGAYVNRRGLGSMFSPGQLGDTLATHWGTVWGVRALLFLLALVVLVQLERGRTRVVRSAPWLVGTAAVMIGLLRTPGLVSHASEGRWAWAGSVADLVHLLGVALWIGGLAVLALVVLPRRQPAELQLVVPRFSRMAGLALGAVVAGGGFMSWQLVGGLHGLTVTHFGKVLLVKLLIFAAVLGAAAFSRRWVDQRLTWAVVTDGDAAAVRPFVYSVLAETVLAIGVLGVASVLVNTAPAR
jgi:copper transport protein